MSCTKSLCLSDSSFSSWFDCCTARCECWAGSTSLLQTPILPGAPSRGTHQEWQQHHTLPSIPQVTDCKNIPILKNVTWGHQSQLTSKGIQQESYTGTHSRSNVLGKHSSSVPISKDTAEPTLLIASKQMLLDRAAFKTLGTNFPLPRLFKQGLLEIKQLPPRGRIRTWRSSSFPKARCGHFIPHFQPCQEGNTTPSPQLPKEKTWGSYQHKLVQQLDTFIITNFQLS